jgi:hypothetical protein
MATERAEPRPMHDLEMMRYEIEEYTRRPNIVASLASQP